MPEGTKLTPSPHEWSSVLEHRVRTQLIQGFRTRDPVCAGAPSRGWAGAPMSGTTGKAVRGSRAVAEGCRHRQGVRLTADAVESRGLGSLQVRVPHEADPSGREARAEPAGKRAGCPKRQPAGSSDISTTSRERTPPGSRSWLAMPVPSACRPDETAAASIAPAGAGDSRKFPRPEDSVRQLPCRKPEMVPVCRSVRPRWSTSAALSRVAGNAASTEAWPQAAGCLRLDPRRCRLTRAIRVHGSGVSRSAPSSGRAAIPIRRPGIPESDPASAWRGFHCGATRSKGWPFPPSTPVWGSRGAVPPRPSTALDIRPGSRP